MNHVTNESARLSDPSPSLLANHTLLSVTSIIGDEVCNLQEEKLGTIQDIMLDCQYGSIRYAVLSSGGFLGMGDRLFAVPWKALQQDSKNKRFTLDIELERLKNAPGFDKDHWPDMADSIWNSSVESYYTSRAEPRML